MLPCFFGGFRSRLFSSVAERLNQLAARRARQDDFVDEAELGRHVGVGELLAVLGAPSAARIAAGSAALLDLALVDDVDRALGAHHGDLGRGPGEVHVGADVLARHHAVGAAVGLARDHGDLRHGGLGERVEQLGAVADDAAVLLLGPGRKPGHVLEGDERDVEAVAEAHEARAFTDASMSSEPASTAGWLATMPTGRPPSRAKPTTMFFAKCSCTSRNAPSSTTARMRSCMS